MIWTDSSYGLRPGPGGPRKTAPWGACVHTTGRNLAARARKRLGRVPSASDVTDEALAFYAKSKYGPGYVVGLKGDVWRVARDEDVTWHVGGGFRDEYMSGKWEKLVNPTFLALWRARWPRRKSPQHLFPHARANVSYLGIELVPTTNTTEAPVTTEETFTFAQYDALDDLLYELGEEWGWPDGWRQTARLVGHEDVGPLGEEMNRFDAGGGWDPGALRARPRFRWDRLGVTR